MAGATVGEVEKDSGNVVVVVTMVGNVVVVVVTKVGTAAAGAEVVTAMVVVTMVGTAAAGAEVVTAMPVVPAAVQEAPAAHQTARARDKETCGWLRPSICMTQYPAAADLHCQMFHPCNNVWKHLAYTSIRAHTPG
eukprot:5706502-Prymnesium_polylepis.3